MFRSQDRFYAPYLFSVNTELLNICRKFIGKEICTTDNLDSFIKQRFMTPERYSIMLSWFAIGISVLAALASVILPLIESHAEDTYRDRQLSYMADQTKLLQEINGGLSEISNSLEDLPSSDDIDLAQRNISNKLREIKREIEDLEITPPPSE